MKDWLKILTPAIMLVFLVGGVIAATDMQTKQTCNCGCNLEKRTTADKIYKSTFSTNPEIVPPKIPKEVKHKKLPRVLPPSPEEVKETLRKYNRSKVIISTKGLDPEEVRYIVKKYKTAGINVETADYTILGQPYWECDAVYYGWVYINNVDDVYWYAVKCSDYDIKWDCETYRPSESYYCDIHYESWMYFYDEGGTTRGMINFPGCQNAWNCNGNCGDVNTLYNGECGLKYSDLPLNNDHFYVYAEYMLSKYPTGECDHCDCLVHWPFCDDYPQMMITNIYVVSQ